MDFDLIPDQGNGESYAKLSAEVECLKRKLGKLEAAKLPFPIPTMEGYEFVLIGDIIRCQADSNLCNFYCENGETYLSVNLTLKEVEKLLTPFGFLRIHQSHLVNMSWLKSLKGQSLYLRDGMMVPVARRRLSDVKKQLCLVD